MPYRLAALAIGLIIALYWGQVIRMAQKARRKTGRAANFVPQEPLGRLLRVLWIPVVVLWVAIPFLVSLAHVHSAVLDPLLASPWLAWPMFAIVLTCYLLSRVCWRAMGKNWRMGIDPGERTSLIAFGPFAYVRHPIYALSQMMMLATAIAIPSPLMIACAVLHILLLQWEARREERHMLAMHGSAYSDYCQRVRRFFPRWRPSARPGATF